MLDEILRQLESVSSQIKILDNDLKYYKNQRDILERENSKLNEEIRELNQKKCDHDNSLLISIEKMNDIIDELISCITRIYNYTYDIESIDKLKNKIFTRIEQVNKNFNKNSSTEDIKLTHHERASKIQYDVIDEEETTGDQTLDGMVKKCDQFGLITNDTYVSNKMEKVIKYKYDIRKDDSIEKNIITLDHSNANIPSEQVIVKTNTEFDLETDLLTNDTGELRFKGWSYEPNGPCIQSEKIKISEDVTLYSIWVENTPIKESMYDVSNVNIDEAALNLQSVQTQKNCTINLVDRIYLKNLYNIHEKTIMIEKGQKISIMDRSEMSGCAIIDDIIVNADEISINFACDSSFVRYTITFKNLRTDLNEIKHSISPALNLSGINMKFVKIDCDENRDLIKIGIIYEKTELNPKKSMKFEESKDEECCDQIENNKEIDSSLYHISTESLNSDKIDDKKIEKDYFQPCDLKTAIVYAIDLGFDSRTAMSKVIKTSDNTKISTTILKSMLERMSSEGTINYDHGLTLRRYHIA